MIWLQAILSAALICLFSATTHAQEKSTIAHSSQPASGYTEKPASGYTEKPATGFTETPLKKAADRKKFPMGVAEIDYYREGTICTGVHLKPWILLVVADCVYGRVTNKLFGKVTTSRKQEITVEVESITFHPKYKKGKVAYNIALMVVYGHIDWDVEPFQLTSRDFTTREIIQKQFDTFVVDWESDRDDNFYPVTRKTGATEKFDRCGALGNISNWYCVDEGVRVVSNKVNLGTPFFYVFQGKKKVLGVYTGEQLDKKSPGRLYQTIFPSFYWIEEFVSEHPIPPE